MRRLVALALLLLAVPVLSAPGPNPRPPVAMGAAVTSLSMAEDGTMLVTMNDPGSSTPTPGNPGPNVATWSLVLSNGSVVRAGSSDLQNCASRLGDMCQTSAVAGAAAGVGGRFAVVANVAASVADSTRAQLLLLDGSGVRARHLLSQPAVAVAMDRAGTSVAVLQRVSNVGAADSSRVEWFDVDDSFALSPVLPAQGLSGAPVALTMSADRARLVAVTDRVHFFTHSTALPTALGSGTPRAAAIAGSGSHALVWGTAEGDVIYGVDGSPGLFGANVGSPVNSVAVDQNGTRAAIGSNDLRVLELRGPVDPPVRTLKTAQLAEPARQVLLTPDAKYLALRTNSSVQLYEVANLTRLWSHAPATPPAFVAVSGSADVTASVVANAVVTYPVVHGVKADATKEVLRPGQGRHIPVALRNDGNRPEHANLSVWFPIGWYAALDRNNASVPVDGAATLDLHVIVPALQAPGKYSILLNHTLASGGKGSSAIEIEVPGVDLVAFTASGPASVGIRGGETVTFSALLESRGNKPFGAKIDATVEPTWSMSYSPRDAVLLPGEAVTVNVTLTAPPVVQEGDSARVRLVLRERPQDPVDFYATVGARFRVNLDLPPFADVGAGNTTTIEVALLNVGNVPDSYDVRVEAPDGWSATLSEATVRDVAAGQLHGLILNVTAPPDAEPGRRVTVAVTATSQGNPEQSARESVLVRVTGVGELVVPEVDLNWGLIGVVALAVVAMALFVGGYFLVRRK